MKIIFKKEDFLSSLNIVSKALKSGNVYKILECILIDASKDKIILTCQDGKEITIKSESKGDIKEKGKAAIDGSQLINMIRKMDGSDDIELIVNEKRECTIRSTNSEKEMHYDLQTFDEKNYPNVMSLNKDNKVVLNEYKLKKIIEKTSFSYDRGQNSDNIILKGIYLKVDKENITAKSMNGFTLSILNESLGKDFGKFETIVPGSSLEEVNKILKGDVDKDVNIYFNDKNIGFEFNNTLFTSIIIPNSYIDTEKILNTEYSTKVIVNRYDFIESLERSSICTNEKDKKPVIFDIKDDKMTIKLNSLNANFSEKINIKTTGKELMIAFNPNHLINILNVIDDEEVTLYFSGPKQPIIIKDKQETYIYLLTPVSI